MHVGRRIALDANEIRRLDEDYDRRLPEDNKTERRLSRSIRAKAAEAVSCHRRSHVPTLPGEGYARIRGDKAFAEAERAWTVESQSGLIENRAT